MDESSRSWSSWGIDSSLCMEEEEEEEEEVEQEAKTYQLIFSGLQHQRNIILCSSVMLSSNIIL